MKVSFKMNLLLELLGFLLLSEMLFCIAQGNVHYYDFVVSVTNYFTITFQFYAILAVTLVFFVFFFLVTLEYKPELNWVWFYECLFLKLSVGFFCLQLKESNFTKLCSTKSMLTVNGSFPGPMIRAHKGDTVYVNVYNQGGYGVTIHWYFLSRSLIQFRAH